MELNAENLEFVNYLVFNQQFNFWNIVFLARFDLLQKFNFFLAGQKVNRVFREYCYCIS